MLDKILNIDCLEGMKNIESNSIDLIICDLPYGVTDCSWDSVIPFDELWEQYRRILKPGGACCLFGSQPFTTDVINSNRRWFQYCWYWDKVGSTGFGFAKYQPMRRIEEIAVFYKPVNGKRTEKYRYYPDVRPADRKRRHKPPRDGVYRDSLYTGNHGECFTGYPDNVIRISSRGRELASGKRLHPTQKPLDLLEFLLNLPRLKSRGSQPRILTDSDTLGYPRSSYGSCICYTPIMRSPSFRIFMAAFMSLSWTAPHCGQAHSRTDKSLVSACL